MLLGVSRAVVAGEVVTGDIEVENGVVTAVGVPRSHGDLLAVPGFVDVHVHGYAGVEFADASVAEHRDLSRAIPMTGVTAYQPTLWTMSVEETIEALERHPGTVAGGARVLGFHLEGPFLAPERPGAHRPDLLRSPTRELVRRFAETGPVSQLTIAPELQGAFDVIEHLAAAGVGVSLGHSVATSSQTARGLDLGATAFTHVFNAMGPLHHREPGILGRALADDRAFVTAIFDGVHLSDEASLIALRCAGDRLVAITDGTAATGASNDRLMLGGQEVEIRDGAPRLADGTIAGSALTMDAAFRKLISLGLDLPAAVRATSGAPAQLAGRADLGHLAVGRPADVVVLDDDLTVVRTLIAGRIVYAREGAEDPNS